MCWVAGTDQGMGERMLTRRYTASRSYSVARPALASRSTFA
jgi:hypothetical protein